MSLPLFFLTAIWLPHGQLWATIEGTASLTLMLITAFFYIFEPRNEVGSLSPAKRLVGFELGTFRFWSQRLNPLGDSPQDGEFSPASTVPANLEYSLEAFQLLSL